MYGVCLTGRSTISWAMKGLALQFQRFCYKIIHQGSTCNIFYRDLVIFYYTCTFYQKVVARITKDCTLAATNPYMVRGGQTEASTGKVSNVRRQISVKLSILTRCIPVVVTIAPWYPQVDGSTQVEDCPSNKHIVVNRNKTGNQEHAPPNTYKQKMEHPG